MKQPVVQQVFAAAGSSIRRFSMEKSYFHPLWTRLLYFWMKNESALDVWRCPSFVFYVKHTGPRLFLGFPEPFQSSVENSKKSCDIYISQMDLGLFAMMLVHFFLLYIWTFKASASVLPSFFRKGPPPPLCHACLLVEKKVGKKIHMFDFQFT